MKKLRYTLETPGVISGIGNFEPGMTFTPATEEIRAIVMSSGCFEEIKEIVIEPVKPSKGGDK